MRVNKLTAKFKTGKWTLTDLGAGKNQVNIAPFGGGETSFGKLKGGCKGALRVQIKAAGERSSGS